VNNQYKQSTNSKHGFTIIEVVLVLAIAGLIFLMVFLALPALQRGQRDTQRKDDLSRINTQINNYQSSNRGKIPDQTVFTTSGSGFVTKYLNGPGADGPSQAGTEYADPTTGVGYKFLVNGSDPSLGEISFQTNRICGPDGTAATSADGSTAGARNYVLRISLENQTVPYCIDNR
jgi:prepilin-type N-terminal cleavage/methylation domain-containing protein